MTLFDDTTAHNSDSTTTIVSEADPVTDNHNLVPVAPPASSEEVPHPAEEAEHAAVGHEEKLAATASEDFASALETFTTETEEAAGDDRVIKGTVLKLTATHVVVDIGATSEGMLPISELLAHEGKAKVQPGDEIDVMREKGQTEEGYVNLSHQKAQRIHAWDEIEKAHNEKKPIKGVVIDRIKGGLTVRIMTTLNSPLIRSITQPLIGFFSL